LSSLLSQLLQRTICPPNVTNRLLRIDGVFMKMISIREVLIGQFVGEVRVRPYNRYGRKMAKKNFMKVDLGIWLLPFLSAIYGSVCELKEAAVAELHRRASLNRNARC